MDFANNFFTEHLQLDTSGILKRQVLREIVTQTVKGATPER